MKPTGVGIVGLGHWGKHYVRIFDWLLPDAEVVEATDLCPENLHTMRIRHPRVSFSPNYLELIDNPRVAAVVVATPASSHYEITRAALLADKHVLVEKPLTLRTDQARDLADLAAARKRVVLVGHTFLYNPAVRKLKEILSSQGFGDIYYLSSRRTNLGPIREDTNVVSDLAPHDISIFNYLLGSEPLRVSAVGGCYLKPGRADVAFIDLEYPRGVRANLQVSWVDSHKVRELVVVGAQRRVEFNDLDRLEPIRVVEKGIAVDQGADSFGEFQYQVRDGDITSPRVATAEPLKVLCQHFLRCIRHGDSALTDAENGLAVVRALTAIEKSLASNGAPVEIDAETSALALAAAEETIR